MGAPTACWFYFFGKIGCRWGGHCRFSHAARCLESGAAEFAPRAPPARDVPPPPDALLFVMPSGGGGGGGGRRPRSSVARGKPSRPSLYARPSPVARRRLAASCPEAFRAPGQTLERFFPDVYRAAPARESWRAQGTRGALLAQIKTRAVALVWGGRLGLAVAVVSEALVANFLSTDAAVNSLCVTGMTCDACDFLAQLNRIG